MVILYMKRQRIVIKDSDSPPSDLSQTQLQGARDHAIVFSRQQRQAALGFGVAISKSFFYTAIATAAARLSEQRGCGSNQLVLLLE